jgi:dTDP-glucose 4,6-dehydratase
VTAPHVVVAGGAGFLGSHVCDRLIERGDRVTCLDDLSTGSRDNVVHLDDCDRFRFIEHDVVAADTTEVLDLDGVTAVMHLASPASPPEFLRRPLDTLFANSTGTHHLLELARRHHARFFLASTSEVYGDPLVHPQPESYWGNVNPNGTRAVYDESKRFAEAITMTYHREYDLEVRIARVFNTYGPRMQPDDGRVITNFVHQALAGEPITIYGDGSQTRSFCYVDDEVTGFLALLDGPHSGPINIGNPVEFTMHELATLVTRLIATTSTVQYRPLPADDPKLRRPDITLATDLLGWTPTVELPEGLAKTIDWFRS